MTTLPRRHEAIVEMAKITRYLLNGSHPENQGKAAFIQGHSFASRSWEVFAQTLRQNAVQRPVTASQATGFGHK